MAEILLNLDKITFQYTTRLLFDELVLFSDYNFQAGSGDGAGFVATAVPGAIDALRAPTMAERRSSVL